MRQVILCVETNKQANTDVGYIDAVIKQLYQIDTEIKFEKSRTANNAKARPT